VGAGRAAIVVAWLRRHETQLRLRVDADVDTRDPLVADDVVQVWPAKPVSIDGDGAGQSEKSSARLADRLTDRRRGSKRVFFALHRRADSSRVFRQD
jgi:hypothetical protein